MKDDQSDAFAIKASDFDQGAPFVQQAEFLLRYATLAPSGHNTQPWLFALRDHWIDVIADRRRALPIVDPHDRELVISCGAAIATLKIAAAHFGFQSTVSLSPDRLNEDLLARIRFDRSKQKQSDTNGLFAAITQRRTTRARYGDELPPTALINTCVHHAKAHHVEFRTLSDEATRRKIADLVAEGDRLQFDDPTFRRELAAWVHSNSLGSRDGMSGTGFGMPDILAPIARFAIRTFDLGNRVAAADEKTILEGTPLLGVLSSPADDQHNWLQTGRALAYILLELTAQDFTASYLNQPIETAGLRPKLKAVAGLSGLPQILIRIGRAPKSQAPTVRRDVASVIM